MRGATILPPNASALASDAVTSGVEGDPRASPALCLAHAAHDAARVAGLHHVHLWEDVECPTEQVGVELPQLLRVVAQDLNHITGCAMSVSFRVSERRQRSGPLLTALCQEAFRDGGVPPLGSMLTMWICVAFTFRWKASDSRRSSA